MTTVTSGDKRIDKYDYEKHQDGDYLLTKVNKTNVFLLFSYKCCLRIRTSIRDLHCLLGLVNLLFYRPARPRMDRQTKRQFWDVLNVSLCAYGAQLG